MADWHTIRIRTAGGQWVTEEIPAGSSREAKRPLQPAGPTPRLLSGRAPVSPLRLRLPLLPSVPTPSARPKNTTVPPTATSLVDVLSVALRKPAAVVVATTLVIVAPMMKVVAASYSWCPWWCYCCRSSDKLFTVHGYPVLVVGICRAWEVRNNGGSAWRWSLAWVCWLPCRSLVRSIGWNAPSEAPVSVPEAPEQNLTVEQRLGQKCPSGSTSSLSAQKPSIAAGCLSSVLLKSVGATTARRLWQPVTKFCKHPLTPPARGVII